MSKMPDTKKCFICGNKERYRNQSYCKKCVWEIHKLYKRARKKPFIQELFLDNEVWLPVINYSNSYSVSNLGRLKSLPRLNKDNRLLREKIMKQHISKLGYKRVSLFNGIGYDCLFVHRILAVAFLPNPENKPEVNHKNGIKTDNRLENLEWATKKENSQHALITGLITQVGEKGYFSKLTNVQAKCIYVSHLPSNKLAKRYKVCIGTIDKIRSGSNWRQITNGLTKSTKWRNGLKKLTDTQVMQIFESKLSLRQTAKIFDISYITVSDIRSGKSRSKITGKIHNK